MSAYMKTHIKQILIFLIVISVSGVFFLSVRRGTQNVRSISDEEMIFGTFVSIQIFDTKDETLLEESFARLRDLDNKMSLNIDGSEVNQINALAGQEAVYVSEDTFYVIQKAIEYSQMSEGAFDITMEPVIDLWGIGTDRATVPEEKQIKDALFYVDYHNITIDEEARTVRLEEGMSIDLGGIAKGYAADEVALYLTRQGVQRGIINIGGNVMLLGEKEKNKGFKVGLQDPYAGRNQYFGVLEIGDATVVTSGVYERNFEKDGVLYHHILNPDTGKPVRNSVAAVSVIAERSIDADALSTVLFAIGKEKGLELVENLLNIECIYVMDDYRVYTSSGIDQTMLSLTRSDYLLSK